MKQISLSLQDIFPLMEQAFEAGQEVYLTIRGNSMTPFLHDRRDQAVFSPLKNRTIRKGDILFYQRTGGQYVMHRVYAKEKNGTLTMLGDAQWTLEKGVQLDQIRAYVPRVVRKGKEINCEKGSFRFLMTLWQKRIQHPRLAKACMKVLQIIFAMKSCILRLIKRKN